MAPKLVPMEEAARYLGITVEELTAMRSRNEIYGYRDGSSWKFKQDELDRVLSDLRSSGSPGGSGIHAPALDLDQDDSILVSDEELGHSAEGTSSTVIGGGKKEKNPGASDIELGGERGIKGSDVNLIAGSNIGGSDVELIAGSSDVHAGQKRRPGGSGTGSDKDLAPLDVAASDLELGDAISLGDDLKLSESPSGKRSADSGKASLSGIDDESLTPSGIGSGVDLDIDGDDMVLGGTGSDVTLGAHDSGINLTRPSESGLALDSESLDLAGGSHVESLELGEDNVVPLDSSADPDLATQLKADDDFLLTPVEDTGNQESDSGSQVIALDTEEFDRNAATMLGAGAAPLLEEEQGGPAPLPDLGGAALGAPGLAPMQQPVAPIGELPETPYDIWNVLGLAVVTLSLSVCGIMMVDLMRNIWSWEGTFSFNSSLMDAIVKMFEG